ncbi:2-deoxy-D-gluconate 3-dehydrogenase, N-ter fragment [Escherichia coli]|uniref:2-deoxy-D-gluconate 3-dehydrogenase, N-ter n=1 Tax=Escherichia coli TaxID=562 RepID=A0A377C049_ECOLX|nr:2-deoxy-D-gluconate 3-dehydrogenase, N-ter fragment [Escherichia coli]
MILSAFSLEGKVAVVTGCDTGLGQGMALGLAQAAVTLLALTSLNRLKPSSRSQRWGVVF